MGEPAAADCAPTGQSSLERDSDQPLLGIGCQEIGHQPPPIHCRLSAVVGAESDKRELLFLSRASALDGSAAVRGGIPVVFPLFGEIADVPEGAAGRDDVKDAGRHGFARTQTWTLERSDDSDSSASVTLVLDTQKRDDVLKRYPFPCLLRYTV